VNRGQAASSRAFDVLGEIVEKYDTLRLYPDGFYDVIISLGIGFPKPDRRRQVYFTEMTEHVSVFSRKIFDVSAVGIGEGVKWKTLGGAGEQRLDAGHFACKNRVPAFEKLFVRKAYAKRTAQACKEGRVADLAFFVASIQFVARKSRYEILRLASGMASPALERSVEIDVDYHATEIE